MSFEDFVYHKIVHDLPTRVSQGRVDHIRSSELSNTAHSQCPRGSNR